MIRRVTLLFTVSSRQVVVRHHLATRRWQSRSSETLPSAVNGSDFRYEDFYDRLLKVYGTPDGRVSVSNFLEVFCVNLYQEYTLGVYTSDVQPPGFCC